MGRSEVWSSSGRRPWVPSGAASLRHRSRDQEQAAILLWVFWLLWFLEGLGENISLRKSLFGACEMMAHGYARLKVEFQAKQLIGCKYK